MTSSSGGSPRRARSCEAADTGDMSSNSLTAAGSSSVSMARSTTSMTTAPRCTAGSPTIRGGRTRPSASGCTPRPPPPHRTVAGSRDRDRRAGSALLDRPGWTPAQAELMGGARSGGIIGTPTHSVRCDANTGGDPSRGRRHRRNGPLLVAASQVLTPAHLARPLPLHASHTFAAGESPRSPGRTLRLR